ncbi:hypothetical protein TEA_029534 [Camellia sinensis var. sinensis]|uniref:Uncharacterized protein n=1 Tax=Camellia sinensis var. sinensis TaxID=542762 RepID=A0A4S4D8V8_CAMSN|nr:hypothetical protein TEA_029534 [Camellia sinensis var. sinensis]
MGGIGSHGEMLNGPGAEYKQNDMEDCSGGGWVAVFRWWLLLAAMVNGFAVRKMREEDAGTWVCSGVEAARPWLCGAAAALVCFRLYFCCCCFRVAARLLLLREVELLIDCCWCMMPYELKVLPKDLRLLLYVC